MNEYIKTAQELAKLPGTDKWPWYLIKTKNGIDRCSRMVITIPENEIISPWLRIDDFSLWSSAKWLERANVTTFRSALLLRGPTTGSGIISRHWPDLPTELDYNKAILSIGQKAQSEGGAWLEAWNRGQDVTN